MRVGTLIELGLVVALSGCAGHQTTIGSSVGEQPADGVDTGKDATAGDVTASKPAPAPAKAAPASNEPEPPPPPDPALVKALVDKTGEAPSIDNPLHLRLEVTPRPAGELWL